MRRALPPLNSLRAFEAAARHLSFTKAADELSVTQAAVSHQVKALEERLGVTLFRRLPRGLLLTDEGQALLPELSDAFERLGRAVDRVGARGADGVLSVSLMATFALSWLVPRLPRFQAAHPEIEVRVSTTSRLVDFAREDVDAAIRHGRGQWLGLRADKLFDYAVTPLCGRAFKDKLRRPQDLLDVPLLDDVDDQGEWLMWMEAAGVKRRGRGPVARFDSTQIAVQASIDGLGVALGSPELFARDIAAGSIFQPFKLVVPIGKAYWLVYPETAADRPKIAAFRAWCLAEATASRPANARAGNRSGRAAAAARPSATAARAPGRGDGSDG
ncbi:MAG: transcriptional regulator GcvA [Proteobacteria bacterium]|nr:transcriptional regulator GcvA [Pseudomonadota bacterium]